MATTLYDLCVNITANGSEAVNGINSVGESTSGLSAKTVAMGQIMADAFEAVISKVAEYGKKVIEVGAEQETALAKVNTIMDQSVMSTTDMADSIKSLSSEMGISVSELSDTVYNAISATGDTANAIEYAEQASKLATAGFTDTSSALSVLTTAMNAYGDEAGTAEEISDSLIQVQNLGVTTVSELSSGIGKAIAMGSSYGVSLGNIESAYVSMTKQGIATAESTTYMNSMMKELGDSGSDVSAILQEVSGKTFGQLMNEGASLADVLEILQESTGGDAEAFSNLWSSAEAGLGASAIINNGLETFNENLETIQNTSGATESAFETMADTLDHQVSVFQTTGENLMSSLYDGLSSKLGDVVGFGTDMLTELSEAFEEGGIDTLAFRLGDVISEALEQATEYIPDILTVAFNIIEGLAEGLSENGNLLAQNAMDIIQTLVNQLNSNLPQIITCAFYMIQELAIGIGESLPELIPSIVDLVLNIVDALIDNADLLIEGAIALILGLTEGIINALPELIVRIPELVNAMNQAIIDNAPQLFVGALNLVLALLDGLVNFWSYIIQRIPSLIRDIVGKFKEGKTDFSEVGKNLIEGLWSGIKDRWSKLVEDAKNLGSTLLKTLRDLFGVHSPSTVFRQIGEYCVEGFEQGIADLADGTVLDGVQSQLDSMGTRKFNFGSLTGSSSEYGGLENNITITLEGDAKQLFKVMQTQSKVYNKTTGKSAFA